MGVGAQWKPVVEKWRWLKVWWGSSPPSVIEVCRCCSLHTYFHTHFLLGHKWSKQTQQIPQCSVLLSLEESKAWESLAVTLLCKTSISYTKPLNHTHICMSHTQSSSGFCTAQTVNQVCHVWVTPYGRYIFNTHLCAVLCSPMLWSSQSTKG